jgi:hypothetical protein
LPVSGTPPRSRLINIFTAIHLSHVMRAPPLALTMREAQPMHLDTAPILLALEQVKPTRRLALKAHSIWQVYLFTNLLQQLLLRLPELPSHEHAEIFAIGSVDAYIPSKRETHH